ncbi:hypothetical protein KC19_VG134000 [Ceratodon purpureus]|uniref:Uncharacterized protein n=1 Tax=Ceratodon purpureus TaxID=3225 RepID=A0A8T0HPY6_CERPU|nr:hypothetical protein KC19_VG134000 [Ceratodon purpureus]
MTFVARWNEDITHAYFKVKLKDIASSWICKKCILQREEQGAWSEVPGDKRSQIRAWRSPRTVQVLKNALMTPFKPKGTNQEILCLLAQELDSGRRDTRFKAPLCVPLKK